MAIVRAPLPPFTRESALRKVRAEEDAWNLCEPERVAQACSEDSAWRNRAEFLVGRQEIRTFLQRKWAREHEYRLIKELWAYDGNFIAVRFAYEYHDEAGNWFRAYGNEDCGFDRFGLMRISHVSINEISITPLTRLFRWNRLTARPASHPGLSDLGL